MPRIGKDGLTSYQRALAKDPVGFRARNAAYARTPAQRLVRNAYARKWKKEHRAQASALALRSYYRTRPKLLARLSEAWFQKRYGVSAVEAYAMKECPCHICGTSARKRDIDHDHAHTEKPWPIRGILCMSCNQLLGRIEKLGIHKFMDYLGHPPAPARTPLVFAKSS